MKSNALPATRYLLSPHLFIEYPRQILAENSRRIRHRTSPCLRGCVMGHHRTSLTKGARIARAACNYPTYITLAEEPTHPFERIYFLFE